MAFYLSTAWLCLANYTLTKLLVENPRYKVVFMGTPIFAVPSLKTLIADDQFEVVGVVTQPDKPTGRGQGLSQSPVKSVALENKLTVLTPSKIKHDLEFLNQLKDLQPDVIVVVAYGKILPQAVLNIPKFGIINVHASLLPKYRGASPITAAILNGDKITGITLMKMDLAMDTGPIIATSEEVAIRPEDTTAALSEKLSDIGANLLIEYLPKYLVGEITPRPQDEMGATYVKTIQKSDGKINWQEDAEIIERKIRAYYPWPGSCTNFNGKLLKILQTELLPENPVVPGTVWPTLDKYPAIATIKGSLKISKLQLEGKSVTSGKDFLLGYPVFIGSILS
jgi:methionyl-tRNA formyltransferase